MHASEMALALQGDLEKQIGRLRLADTSEIPIDLQFSNQGPGPGLAVLPDEMSSDDLSSATDSDDRLELPREELYSSDELLEGEVSSAIICQSVQALIHDPCLGVLWRKSQAEEELARCA